MIPRTRPLPAFQRHPTTQRSPNHITYLNPSSPATPAITTSRVPFCSCDYRVRWHLHAFLPQISYLPPLPSRLLASSSSLSLSLSLPPPVSDQRRQTNCSFI